MPDWTAITTALLDMDGPLLDLAYDEWFWHECLPERYAVVHGMPAAAAREKLRALYKTREGHMDWYDVDYWSRQVGFDVAAVKVRTADHIVVHPDTVPFLEYLDMRGVTRVLLTNAHPKTLRLKMAVTGLERHLDEVISTFRYGVGKEEAGLWKKLAAELGYAPEKAMLVEDSVTNLNAAKAAGIGHLVYVTGANSGRRTEPRPEFTSVENVGKLL